MFCPATFPGDAFLLCSGTMAHNVESRPAQEEGGTRAADYAGADTPPALEARVDTQTPQEAATTQPAREFVRIEPQPAAELARHRRWASCSNALRAWRPSFWVSVPLASAFTLFLTLVTVEGSPVNLWTVSAVVVIVVLLVVAGVAAFVCPTQTPEGPQRGGEQEL